MSLFYIDIHFPSFVNEGHSADTQFCTHDLIKENDWNDHSYTPKIMSASHALTCVHSISNGRDSMSSFQIKPSDRKISYDQVCMVSMHCV